MSPKETVFDEHHYIPAAKSIAILEANTNWEHPPLAKLIVGLGGGFIYTITDGILPDDWELACYRFICLLFGIWILYGIYRWMRALNFPETSSVLGMWLTGFGFTWFIQSRTVMLEIFYAAFGIWGLLHLHEWQKQNPSKRGKFVLGFFLLGLSIACKWSGVSFLAIALIALATLPTNKPLKYRFASLLSGVLIVALTYVVTFLPLTIIDVNPLSISEIFSWHGQMWRGHLSLKEAKHPYASHFWEWPTLIRPMWYHYKVEGQSAVGVFAGGNPAIFWISIPVIIFLLYASIAAYLRILKTKTIQIADDTTLWLGALFWVNFGLWISAPRSTQYFYYYFIPSLWLGPILVWFHDRFIRRKKILITFVLISAALFFWFLPIMDARPIGLEEYKRYMWFQKWI